MAIPAEQRPGANRLQAKPPEGGSDGLLVSMGRQRFSWGSTNLVNADETRQRYVAALRAADEHDYAPLMRSVGS